MEQKILNPQTEKQNEWVFKNLKIDAPFEYSSESHDRADVTKVTGDGSITPQTHRFKETLLSKEFRYTKEQNKNSETDEKEEDMEVIEEGNFIKQIIPAGAIFTTEYQYKESKTSHVVRFVINAHIEYITEKMKELKSKSSEQIRLTAKTTAKYSKLKKAADKITISDVEKAIVDKAIDHLNNTDHKSVLIDVIDRSNCSGTHTAVLYKQNENIILIDPNNPCFSAFLLSYKEDLKICKSSKKLPNTIYKYEGEKGTKLDQGRDCIDIAVKLAFSLNHSKIPLEIQEAMVNINLGKGTLHNNIETISNNQEVNKFIPNDLKDSTFRVKQSSNILESKKATLYLKYYIAIFQLIFNEKFNPHNLEFVNCTTEQIKLKLNEFIEIAKSNKEYEKTLNDLDAVLTDIFKDDSCIKEFSELNNGFLGELKYIDDNYQEGSEQI